MTGSFVLLDSPDRAARRRVALDECVRLEREMTVLRSRAESETQMRRRVDLNLELKRLEATLAELARSL